MQSLYQTLNRIDQIQNVFTSWKPTQPTTDTPELKDDGNSTNPIGEVTSDVSSFIDYLSQAQANPYPFADLVNEASEKYGLPDSLIKSVIQAESSFDENALSPKGAMGLMQLMPETAAQYRVDEPYSPQANIDTGSKHLRNLLDRYDGNLIKALAAYNAGGNSIKENTIPPYQETQNYVKKVIQNYMKFNGVEL